MDVDLLVEITERLMIKYGIEIRDTWTNYKGIDVSQIHNGYSNELKTEYKEMNGARFEQTPVMWEVPDIKGCLYAEPKIIISEKCEYNHIIVHEIAHFLQHITREDDENYFTIEEGSSIPRQMSYVNQRIEKEAFFIQVKFMHEYEREPLEIMLAKAIPIVNEFIEIRKGMELNDEKTGRTLYNLYERKMFNSDN